MTTPRIFHRWVLMGLFGLLVIPATQGQLLKKLGKRAERAAERTIEQRVDKEASEKTDQVLDSILEPGKKGPNQAPSQKGQSPSEGGDQGASTSSGGNTPDAKGGGSNPGALQVYSKFDFVPGEKLLFYDDFGDDFVGDFPARWNTNGSGEVVTVGDSREKWFRMIPGFNIFYLPNIQGLPNDYTIEFDLLSRGLDRQTSSTAGITVYLDDDTSFNKGEHWGWVFIPVGQYGAFDIRIRNYKKGEGSTINSSVRGDIRQAVLERPHVSIAVNDQRFRLWINEVKYVDVPQFVPQAGIFQALKFNVNNLKDGKEDLFIANLKIAEGGVDLRRKLLAEGRISTNAILFDSGSARLQAASMGVIRQIYQVLQQDPSISLQIVGHTDSDGAEDTNQTLSEDRASAVRDALITIYGVEEERLTSLGKGESEPVSENSNPAGKAKNRRVEFIKI